MAKDEKPTTMKPNPGTPPGMEVDNHGHPIPLAERTKDDQEKAAAAAKKAK